MAFSLTTKRYFPSHRQDQDAQHRACGQGTSGSCYSPILIRRAANGCIRRPLAANGLPALATLTALAPPGWLQLESGVVAVDDAASAFWEVLLSRSFLLAFSGGYLVAYGVRMQKSHRRGVTRTMTG